MLTVLKVIAIVFSFIFSAILAWFASALRWSKVEDRPSLIGFFSMAAVYLLDIALLMFG